jgi:hypothetical protein
LGEQVNDVTERARERLTEFVDLIDEEAGESRAALVDFSPDMNYLSPGEFVKVTHTLGFKRNHQGQT